MVLVKVLARPAMGRVTASGYSQSVKVMVSESLVMDSVKVEDLCLFHLVMEMVREECFLQSPEAQLYLMGRRQGPLGYQDH